MKPGDAVWFVETKGHANGSVTLNKRAGRILSVVAGSDLAYVQYGKHKAYIDTARLTPRT